MWEKQILSFAIVKRKKRKPFPTTRAEANWNDNDDNDDDKKANDDVLKRKGNGDATLQLPK